MFGLKPTASSEIFKKTQKKKYIFFNIVRIHAWCTVESTNVL